MPGADDGLESADDVVRRVSARDRARREVDRHGRAGARVDQGVRPCPASSREGVGSVSTLDPVRALFSPDRVGAAAASDTVRPRASVQEVGQGISGEGVVVPGADDGLESADDVARGVSARGRARREVDRHGRVGARVVEGVLPLAAGESVRPLAAFDAIRSLLSCDPVGSRVAAQVVVMGRAREMLEPGERVALRVPSARRSCTEVDRYPLL